VPPRPLLLDQSLCPSRSGPKPSFGTVLTMEDYVMRLNASLNGRVLFVLVHRIVLVHRNSTPL